MFDRVRESRRRLLIVFISLSCLILIITIGFAALSAALNVNMSSITQTTQDWDVGFVPETVTAVEEGTSSVGRTCPQATSTKTSITFGEITLSKPGDSCTYEFTIENNGTIDADLDSILFSDPLEETCTGDASSKTCGNITYELKKGEDPLTTSNGYVCADDSYKVKVIIRNSGNTLATSEITQTSGRYTLTFVQSSSGACGSSQPVDPDDPTAPTLYNVLKGEATAGTYATEYTGSHQDSPSGTGTKAIYHWKADDNIEAIAILDKWNVIFGGFCWQMIRTTDTGGVKLIYNGEPSNGQCNNSGTSQHIGTSKFNANNKSLADVGYMYNTRYISNGKSTVNINTVLTRTSMTGSSNYYYGTGVTFSSGTYTLTGITQGTWTNTYSSSSGLYTCKSTTATTCTSVYYIADGDSYFMYGFEMKNGNLLSYYNTNIKLGTSYTENNGTYTLTDAITIKKANWRSNYSTYKKYYTCGGNTLTCTELKYITTTFDYYYSSISSPSNNYIFAKNFTYDSGTNTYTLGSDRYRAWEMTSTDKANLATHHYTCFNTTGTCQTLSYVYRAVTPELGNYINYINLTGGKSVEDAVDEMLYDDNVNQTDSMIKTYIDDWYRDNLTSYTMYLEDIIFCNNRTQKDASSNGWNSIGGSVGTYMHFNYDLLSCTSDTDKFSVSNNKAKLTYPVGLLTSSETKLLDNNNLRNTGGFYWLGSPYDYYTYASVSFTDSTGSNGPDNVANEKGVRPVVSLKSGTIYTTGDGSKNNPYMILDL